MTAIADPRADWAAHAIGGPSLDLPVYGHEPESGRRNPPNPKRPQPGGQIPEATRPRPPRSIDEHRAAKAAAVAEVLTAHGARVTSPDFPQVLAAAGVLVDTKAGRRVRPLSAETIRLAVAHLDPEAVCR